MRKCGVLFSVVLCALRLTAILYAGGSAPSNTAYEKNQSEGKFPNLRYEKYKLANGLEIILSEDHTLPLVAVNLWYHVGPANERPGRTGLAHLFEHMMFQGSQHVGAKVHFRYLEAAGATTINGNTDFDRTNYFETVPSNQLELALWLESDRMGYLLPTLDAAKLANQRDVVRNERRQNHENAPYGLVEEEVYHQLFPQDHPYYASVIGSHADIEAARLGDVREFFREYYSPNNASVAIVGDFDPKEVKSLVAKYFATLPGGPPVPKIAVVTPPIISERRAVVTDQVELPRVYLAWLTPPIYKRGDAESNLLAQILGGGKASRLYRRLVYEKQIAQSVSAESESFALGSVFEIEATAKLGVKPEEVERAIEDEIELLRTNRPTEKELEGAVNALRAGTIRRVETLGALANRLNQYNQYLNDPGFLAEDLRRFEGVTTQDLQKVAAKELDPNARVVVYGVPGKKVVQDAPKTRAEEESGQSDVSIVGENSPQEVWRNTPPKPSKSLQFVLPAPMQFELDNGLKVFLIERHKLPIVSASLVVLSGAEANPTSKSGLASFTTDMLVEGTHKREAGELAGDVEQIGAVLGTISNYDSVSVSLRVLSGKTEIGFGLLSEVALEPAFDLKEIGRKRSQRLTALVEEKDSPVALRTRTLNHALYGDTPYGYSTLGTEESIKSISQDDILNFWKRGFVPSNAALVVAGDINEGELRKLAAKYFDHWTGSPFRSTPPPTVLAPDRRIYIVDKPGAPQTSLAIATVGVPRSSEDYVPLEVMNMVFGGQVSARINMNLREEHGYTYGARSSFDFRRGAGPFSAWGAIRTDVTAQAVHELFRELDRIRDTTLSEDELKLAKNAWALSLAGKFQLTADIATAEGALFVYGLPLTYYRSLAKQIDAISAADVQRMGKKYLQPESMIVIAVGDRAQIAPKLEKLALGPVLDIP